MFRENATTLSNEEAKDRVLQVLYPSKFFCPFQLLLAHVQVKADAFDKTIGRLKMKTNLTRSLILAAVSLTGGAAAYGQNNVVADVPFFFRAAGQEFDAGTYSIEQFGHSNSGILKLYNHEAGLTRFVTTKAPADKAKNGRPKMVFRCGYESGCALASIQLADGRAWTIRIPHLKPSEMERIAVIYLDRKQAE